MSAKSDFIAALQTLFAADNTRDDAAEGIAEAVADYHQDADQEITTVSSGTHQDAFDVTGVKIIKADTSSNNIVFGGFANGEAGQEITIIKNSVANALIIEHNESSGSQKIFNETLEDLYIDNYCAITLMCDGSSWVVGEQQTTSHVIARSTATTSIATAPAYTTVNLTALVDTLGEFASNVFTAKYAGVYVASWRSQAGNTAWGTVNQYWISALSKNGLQTADNLWWGFRWIAHAAATLTADSVGSAIVNLAKGDTLEMQVTQNSGSPISTIGGNVYNHLHIRRIL
jgi:hypothetical protein